MGAVKRGAPCLEGKLPTLFSYNPHMSLSFHRLLALTAVYGYQNAFGVYQDLYTRSGAASPQGVSWIGSTQLALMAVLGLPAGKLLDAGYFRITTFVGSVIYVFS
jgi:hypothetical protein